MKITKIFLALLLAGLLPVLAEADPFLAWDPVTTGIDGEPLGAGLEVMSYNVYQCGPGVGSCTRDTATRIAVVPAAPVDLSGQPVPRVYLVTAVNKAGESADSLPYKVTPPGVPKELRSP